MQLKTIYFVYDADGGILGKVKYWVNKNILKTGSACELCDITHGTFFVRDASSPFHQSQPFEGSLATTSKVGNWLEIPAGVKRIGRSFFYGFASVTTISIPNGVVVIDDNAFDG